MAKMYGRIESYGDRTCDCCSVGRGKRSTKAQEERRWRSEADLEMDRHYYYDQQEARYQRAVRHGWLDLDY